MKRSSGLTFGLVLLLLVVSQLGESIYLPAFPIMADNLNADTAQVEGLLSTFLFSYGLCQLIYGPLSDCFGRRPVILCSVFLYAITAFVGAVAQNIEQLWWCNTLMGAAIGSGGLMSRTILRDLFQGPALKKATAWVGVTLTIAPLCIPLVGALLLNHYGWRANYICMGALGAAYFLIALWVLPETNPYHKGAVYRLRDTGQAYFQVLTHPVFLGNVFCVALNCGAFMAYQVALPFILQTHLGLDATEYALWSIVPLFGFMLGAGLSSRIERYSPNHDSTRIGLFITLCAAIWLQAMAHLSGLTALLWIIPMVVLLVGSGIIFASTTAHALMPFPNIAGVAGAALGGILNMVAGLASALVAIYIESTPHNVSLVVIAFVLACVGVYYLLVARTEEYREFA